MTTPVDSIDDGLNSGNCSQITDYPPAPFDMKHWSRYDAEGEK